MGVLARKTASSSNTPANTCDASVAAAAPATLMSAPHIVKEKPKICTSRVGKMSRVLPMMFTRFPPTFTTSGSFICPAPRRMEEHARESAWKTNEAPMMRMYTRAVS